MAADQQPATRKVGFWRWVWRLTATLFAVCAVLLALAIGIFRIALPLLPDYQERIEAAATSAIGSPLEIGRINARWRFAGPELVFDEVRLFSPKSGEVMVEAQRGRVVLDFFKLIRSRQIQPKLVVLSGLELDLERETDGSFILQGQKLAITESPTQTAKNLEGWVLPNGRFGLRNVVLNFSNRFAGQPPIEIPDIDLNIDVDDERVRLEGDIQLPKVVGRRLDFSIEADGSIDQVEQAHWQAYVEGNNVNFEGVMEAIPGTLPLSSDGLGSFSLWVGATGREIEEASLNLDLHNVALRGQGPDTGSPPFDHVAGQLVWEKQPQQWSLIGRNIVLARNGQEWPSSEITVSGRSSDDSQTITFNADYLNFLDLQPFISAIPEAQWASDWRTYSPGGEVFKIEGFIEQQSGLLADFGLTAEIRNLSIAPAGSTPGFSGLSGRVFGGYTSGGIDIDSTDATIFLPGEVREPITAQNLDLNMRWLREPGGKLIYEISDIDIKTPHLTTGGLVKLSKNDSDAPLVGDMNLTIDNLDLRHAKKYFPIKRLKEKSLRWLDNALIDGVGRNGVLTLKGPLAKFPFKDPNDGSFRAELDFQNTTMMFNDKWPQATALNAKVVFDRGSVESNIASADIKGVSLLNGKVKIPDLKLPVIYLSGNTDGDLAPLRELLDASPLPERWGKVWPDIAFGGSGSSDIEITLPLRQVADLDYTIKFEAKDTIVAYKNWPQQISNLNGQIVLAKNGNVSESVTGMFLGALVEVQIQPVSGSSSQATQMTLKGRTNAELLGRHLHPSLAGYFEGDADWTADASIYPGVEGAPPFSVRLQSPLEGMAVKLPQPLGKNSEDSRFLDTTMTVQDEQTLSVSADFGSSSNIQALLRHDGRRYEVGRAEMQFGGGTATLPEEETVRITGRVPVLDISEILDFISGFEGNDPWIELDEATLGVASLQGFSQDFSAADLKAIHGDTGWEFLVNGELLQGEVTVPSVSNPDNPVTGSFEVLRWSSSDSKEPIDPAATPSLQVSVENFSFDQYQLGKMLLDVEARENIVALRELTTEAPGFTTRTTGSWVFGNSEPQTFVMSEVKISDMRATLKSLQMAEYMDSDEATVQLELTWPGGWTPDYKATVEGTMKLSIGSGQLHSVDPGAGRVFGLLSLGALPRRLSLDFTDVFGSGFGFDSITGDFEMRDGSAFTDNLALDGPAAAVGIVGRAGLVDKDYDQTAIVYANFGSSLPIAGAIAGGPAVGAALLVFSEIFKKPLRQMGRVTYKITGSWEDPQIVKTGSARPINPQKQDQLQDGSGAGEEVAESPEADSAGAP